MKKEHLDLSFSYRSLSPQFLLLLRFFFDFSIEKYVSVIKWMIDWLSYSFDWFSFCLFSSQYHRLHYFLLFSCTHAPLNNLMEDRFLFLLVFNKTENENFENRLCFFNEYMHKPVDQEQLTFSAQVFVIESYWKPFGHVRVISVLFKHWK